MDTELRVALRALVDRNRIRILARLLARPADPETLAAELRLPALAVRRQLDPLLRAGLVARLDGAAGTLAARPDRLAELGRALAELDREAEGRASLADGDWPHEGEPLADTLARLGLTPDETRTLRGYLVDGRLKTIPAQAKKREVVLRFLRERVFTEDRDYPEKEVNQRLAQFHPDVASLRRYLVDGGLADRSSGMYRRRGHRPGLPPPAE